MTAACNVRGARPEASRFSKALTLLLSCSKVRCPPAPQGPRLDRTGRIPACVRHSNRSDRQEPAYPTSLPEAGRRRQSDDGERHHCGGHRSGISMKSGVCEIQILPPLPCCKKTTIKFSELHHQLAWRLATNPRRSPLWITAAAGRCCRSIRQGLNNRFATATASRMAGPQKRPPVVTLRKRTWPLAPRIVHVLEQVTVGFDLAQRTADDGKRGEHNPTVIVDHDQRSARRLLLDAVRDRIIPAVPRMHALGGLEILAARESEVSF